MIPTAIEAAAAVGDADQVVTERTDRAAGIWSHRRGGNTVAAEESVQQTECRWITQVGDAPAVPVRGGTLVVPNADVSRRIAYNGGSYHRDRQAVIADAPAVAAGTRGIKRITARTSVTGSVAAECAGSHGERSAVVYAATVAAGATLALVDITRAAIARLVVIQGARRHNQGPVVLNGTATAAAAAGATIACPGAAASRKVVAQRTSRHIHRAFILKSTARTARSALTPKYPIAAIAATPVEISIEDTGDNDEVPTIGAATAVTPTTAVNTTVTGGTLSSRTGGITGERGVIYAKDSNIVNTSAIPACTTGRADALL